MTVTDGLLKGVTSARHSSAQPAKNRSRETLA